MFPRRLIGPPFRRGRLRASALGLGLALALAGCSKDQGAPQSLAAGEAPDTLQAAFQSAVPEARALVTDASAALQAGELAKAAALLSALCARPDLTGEQRNVASAALLTANGQLQQAAGTGDAQADQFLKARQVEK